MSIDDENRYSFTNRADAERWMRTKNAEDKYLRVWKVVTWHGESKTLFYVVTDGEHHEADND